MGTSGVRAFDNDDANDWADDLGDADDLSLVESTFDAVNEAELQPRLHIGLTPREVRRFHSQWE